MIKGMPVDGMVGNVKLNHARLLLMIMIHILNVLLLCKGALFHQVDWAVIYYLNVKNIMLINV
jgi:hypothetical protein